MEFTLTYYSTLAHNFPFFNVIQDLGKWTIEHDGIYTLDSLTFMMVFYEKENTPFKPTNGYTPY
jgi:hypothetical protein